MIPTLFIPVGVLAFLSPGPVEMLVIAVVALLLFGSDLPNVARSWGKSFTEFRRGLTGIQNEINDVIYSEPERLEYHQKSDSSYIADTETANTEVTEVEITDTGEGDTGGVDIGEADTGEADTGEADTGESYSEAHEAGMPDAGISDSGESGTDESPTDEFGADEPDSEERRAPHQDRAETQ